MKHSSKELQNAERRAGLATGLSLLFPITLSTMAIVLLAPVLPKLQAEFASVPDVDYWAPMVITTPAICIAALSPIAGAIGDYFGRRRLLLASFVLYGIVGLAPLVLHDLKAILISRIAVGVAEALVMTLSTTLIGDYFEGERRDRWLAAQTAVASLSALLFFNIGGYLGSFGWRTPFWVYGSAFIMMAAVLAFTWEPEVRDASGAMHTAHQAGWKGFPWPALLLTLAVTIFGSVFFYVVQIEASSALNLLGLSDTTRIGFYTSIASLGVPIGTFIYGRLATHKVVYLLAAEFSLLCVGFATMATAHGMFQFLAGCALNQLGAGMLLPTLLVWAMSHLNFEFRARGTGLWQSALALGQFLSPVVVVALQRHTGSLFGAFSILSAACLAGATAAAVTAVIVGTKRARARDAGGEQIARHSTCQGEMGQRR